jgi:hypothetical protein
MYECRCNGVWNGFSIFLPQLEPLGSTDPTTCIPSKRTKENHDELEYFQFIKRCIGKLRTGITTRIDVVNRTRIADKQDSRGSVLHRAIKERESPSTDSAKLLFSLVLHRAIK